MPISPIHRDLESRIQKLLHSGNTVYNSLVTHKDVRNGRCVYASTALCCDVPPFCEHHYQVSMISSHVFLCFRPPSSPAGARMSRNDTHCLILSQRTGKCSGEICDLSRSNYSHDSWNSLHFRYWFVLLTWSHCALSNTMFTGKFFL